MPAADDYCSPPVDPCTASGHDLTVKDLRLGRHFHHCLRFHHSSDERPLLPNAGFDYKSGRVFAFADKQF
jgi:hypothetical protein